MGRYWFGSKLVQAWFKHSTRLEVEGEVLRGGLRVGALGGDILCMVHGFRRLWC